MVAKKVLLSGSVKGKFKQLCKRIAAVNKSNGPFDVLLCVGNPLPQADAEIQASLEEFKSLASNQAEIPVSTYFFVPDQESAERLQSVLSGINVTDKLHVFQGTGLEMVCGLHICFVDSKVSKEAKLALLRKLESATGDVDFCLTDSWPERVTAMCAPGSIPEGSPSSGSQEVAEIALKVRPRYLISAGPVFFARLPYLNKDLGAGSHVTRFIGMAEVGNSGKQKWVHALGLQPAAEMDMETLQQKPTGTTPCPFGGPAKRPAESQPDGQSWRWESQKKSRTGGFNTDPDMVQDDRKTIYVGNLPFSAEDDDIASFLQQCGEVEDVRRGVTNGKPNTYAFVQFKSIEAVERACEMADRNMMGRELRIDSVRRKPDAAPSGDPVQGCWFCLSSDKADVNLIVSIGEEMYVAMDKGPINPHHVLILPIEHRANSLALSSAAFIELDRYLSALRTCFASLGRELLAFERFMLFKSKGGNHLQLNVLSIPAGSAEAVKQAYLEVAKKHDLKFKPLSGPSQGEQGRSALRDAVGDGEYFQVIFPDGSRMVHTIRPGQQHHLPFGREAAAQLAGVPERANWKACQADASEEEKLTSSFKALFQSYDIMS